MCPMTARLIRIDWPDFGAPEVPRLPGLSTMEARLTATRAAMAARGLDVLVVYGDREHAANIHWLTGFDPRFEEALLIVTAQAALLLAGNECLPYTGVSPLVTAGLIQVGHCASFSLPSQPRGGRRLNEWLAEAVPMASRARAGNRVRAILPERRVMFCILGDMTVWPRAEPGEPEHPLRVIDNLIGIRTVWGTAPCLTVR